MAWELFDSRPWAEQRPAGLLEAWSSLLFGQGRADTPQQGEVLAKQRTSELGRLLKAGETSATLACLMGFNPTPPPRPRGTRPCAICLATVHKHLHTRGHTKAHSGSGNS